MSTTTLDTHALHLTADNLGAIVRFTTKLPDGSINAILTGILVSVLHEEASTTVTIRDHTGEILAPIAFVVGHDTEIEVVR